MGVNIYKGFFIIHGSRLHLVFCQATSFQCGLHFLLLHLLKFVALVAFQLLELSLQFFILIASDSRAGPLLIPGEPQDPG